MNIPQLFAENHTGHIINLVVTDDTPFYKVSPVTERKRLVWKEFTIANVLGVPVVKRYFINEQPYLPPIKDCTFHIVSSTVARLYSDIRGDLIYPATNKDSREDSPVFDRNNNLIAVRRLRSPDKLVTKEQIKNLKKVYEE